MSKLKIERLGGLAGFGGSISHLRSQGIMDMKELSETDKETIEQLFSSRAEIENNQAGDTFRYRLSRQTSSGTESIEIDEKKIPEALKRYVKDEFI